MALWMFGALLFHAHDAQEVRDDPAGRCEVLVGLENMRELLNSMPFKPGETPLRAVPNLQRTLCDYYYRGEYDEFWAMEACDQEPHFDKAADIPGTFSGGWYDPFAIATTAQYAAMSAKNKSPQRLDMGPWNHGGRRSGKTYAGDVDFGPEAAYGTEVYGRQRLRWFDRWLKDIRNGVEDDAPVRIFVMGGGDGRRNEEGRLNHGGRWREEREWPLARSERVTYYLRAGGGLSTELPGQSDPPATYTHDPQHPVPTVSATTGLPELLPLPDGFDARAIDPRSHMRGILIDGGAHQKEEPGMVGAAPPYPLLAARPDVLVFSTEPLREDVEVTGTIDVNLWISSSAVDTDFTAKLLDVYPPSEEYPDGYHLNLADSIISPRSLPQRLRARRDDGCGRGIRRPGRAASGQQPVQGGSPHTVGRCEQQLSSVRRKPQYGGAHGTAHALRVGAQHGLPRPRPPFTRGVSHNPSIRLMHPARVSHPCA